MSGEHDERSRADAPEGGHVFSADGRIPRGLWYLWIGFLVFAIVYAGRYALPDFLQWLHEVRR